MLKKTIVWLASLILVINALLLSYWFIWPLYDNSGYVKEGMYRDIKIGDRKEDIIRLTTNPVYMSKLKIIGYINLAGETKVVFDQSNEETLFDSNVWILSYPSIHKEIITIEFEKKQLAKIKYKRDFLSP
jgi:hypothetical protein